LKNYLLLIVAALSLTACPSDCPVNMGVGMGCGEDPNDVYNVEWPKHQEESALEKAHCYKTPFLPPETYKALEAEIKRRNLFFECDTPKIKK
jgi:hypothetical protein